MSDVKTQNEQKRASLSDLIKMPQNYAPAVEIENGLNVDKNASEFSMPKAQETLALIDAQDNQSPAKIQESLFKFTNIRYLDEKLKKNEVSPYDAFLANKFLGINVADYGDKTVDLNLNAKVKGLGLTGSHDKMYSDIDDGNTIDRLIMSSEGNLGVFSNIARGLHTGTKGLTPTSQGEFIANMENASKSFARTMNGGGKVSVQHTKDAKALIEAGNRSEKEYLERLLAVKKNALSSKEQTIRNNIAKGVSIPDVVRQSYANDLKKIAFMENELKSKKGFDYKGYAKMLYDNSQTIGKSLIDENTQKNGVLRRIERRKNEGQ